jgi:hypothetical protein
MQGREGGMEESSRPKPPTLGEWLKSKGWLIPKKGSYILGLLYSLWGSSCSYYGIKHVSYNTVVIHFTFYWPKAYICIGRIPYGTIVH